MSCALEEDMRCALGVDAEDALVSAPVAVLRRSTGESLGKPLEVRQSGCEQADADGPEPVNGTGSGPRQVDATQ